MDNIDRFLYIGFFVLKFYILSKLLWEVAMTITNPRRLLRERKGLSEVVTTLILLAFGVLLATTVIVYTNGVTRARMKSTVGESLRFYKPHIWAEDEVDWNNVYYYTVPQNTTIYRDLNRTDYDSLTGSSVVIDSRTYTQALEKLSARSGGMVIVYAKSPPVIHKDNIRTTSASPSRWR